MGDNTSRATSLSADGRRVVFNSGATNLVPDYLCCWDDVFVRELAPYSISGRVTDRNGNPIEGVTITASSGITGTAVTDGSGSYVVGGLSAGIYMLNPSKEGYGFSPETRTGLSVFGDVSEQNFVGSTGNPGRFLDLPFEYDGTKNTFTSMLLDSRLSGRVTSWFDHDTPTYENNNRMVLYDGALYANCSLCTWSQEDPRHPKFCCTGDGGGYVYDYDGHNGLDLASPTGSPVPIHPAAAGTVAFVSYNTNAYGNYLVIDHENGYYTRYNHLAFIAEGIQPGTYVTRATTLGQMGGTGGPGRSFALHLHFDVFRDNGDGLFRPNDGGWPDDPSVDPYGWKGIFDLQVDPWSVDPRGAISYPLWLYDPDSDPTLVGGNNAETVIRDNGGQVVLAIPGEAVPGTATLKTGPALAAAPAGFTRPVGYPFRLQVLAWQPDAEALSATGARAVTADVAFVFGQPITLTVAFDDSELLHLDPSGLAIRQWDDVQATWQTLTTTVDLENHLAVAHTQALGTYQLQAPLACTTDPWEPDDAYYRAAAAPVNSGPASRAFDIPEDEDWFRLVALSGNTYTIQTDSLAAGVDTIVTILDGDLTPLAFDDNGGGGAASKLEWQPPQDGTYFIRVTPAPGSAYGCDATYGLQVQVAPSSVTVQYPGSISYATCGGWQPFAKPTMDLVPGIYLFSFDGNETELRVSGSTMESSIAILRLLDANGQGLAGGTAEYYDDGWQAFPGSTDDSGALVAAIPGLKSSVTFRITYGGASQEKTQDIASDSYILFQLQGIGEVALAGPETGALGVSHTFTATASPISATLPITYTWEASGQAPLTHAAVASLTDTAVITWTITGTQTVTVTATNVAGTATGTHTLTLYAPPQASFAATPISGTVPLTVTFTNTTTGDYASQSWDFGDGSPTSGEANPTHVYGAGGTYTVTLTATGPGGSDTETKTGYVTVQAAVQADFTASPTNGVAQLSVAFTNTSIGSYTSSQWDFGDGGTSKKQNPTYRYKKPGVYTVSLTVSGPNGTSTATRPAYIVVSAP